MVAPNRRRTLPLQDALSLVGEQPRPQGLFVADRLIDGHLTARRGRDMPHDEIYERHPVDLVAILPVSENLPGVLAQEILVGGGVAL